MLHPEKSHAPLDFLRSMRDAALIRIANAALHQDARKNAFGREKPLWPANRCFTYGQSSRACEYQIIALFVIHL